VGLLVVSRSALKFGSITGRWDDDPCFDGRFTVDLASCPGDAPSLPFAGSAPDAPPLPVVDGVGQTVLQDRAAAWVVRVGSQADAPGLLYLGVVVLVVGVEQVAR